MREKEDLRKEIGWLLAEKYGDKRTVAAEKDIARLEKGEHVDYVIGWVNFLGCKIDLRLKPLIPRPETEHWTEKAIYAIRHTKYAMRVLDIFAGSGCIGLAVLKHVPGARVDFAEREKKFLKQIEINAKLNGIEKVRYRILRSDIFSGVKDKYDYILANPPYVAEKRKSRVQKSVLEQEPRNAVFGGKDGLYYIRKFLKGVKEHLAPGGAAYVEFDSPQKAEIGRIAKAVGAGEIVYYKDQYNNWRYARIVL